VEFTLLWSALLGVAALYGVIWWEARRGNAAQCTRSVWDTALAAGVVGLVVGRLAAMIIAGTNPITHLRDIIVIRGGVDTVWAVIGAGIAFVLLAREETLPLGDAVAPAALAGLAGWHAGCLFTESCLGTPSDLPWAFSLPGSTITRHPVELYAALGLAIGTVVLIWWKRRFPPVGMVTAGGVAWAAGVMLVTEPLRPVFGAGLEWFYALGGVLGVMGMAVLWLRNRRGAGTPATEA
jgi:prolipoprotein diacylglyceryltransferase